MPDVNPQIPENTIQSRTDIIPDAADKMGPLLARFNQNTNILSVELVRRGNGWIMVTKFAIMSLPIQQGVASHEIEELVAAANGDTR